MYIYTVWYNLEERKNIDLLCKVRDSDAQTWGGVLPGRGGGSLLGGGLLTGRGGGIHAFKTQLRLNRGMRGGGRS